MHITQHIQRSTSTTLQPSKQWPCENQVVCPKKSKQNVHLPLSFLYFCNICTTCRWKESIKKRWCWWVVGTRCIASHLLFYFNHCAFVDVTCVATHLTPATHLPPPSPFPRRLYITLYTFLLLLFGLFQLKGVQEHDSWTTSTSHVLSSLMVMRQLAN